MFFDALQLYRRLDGHFKTVTVPKGKKGHETQSFLPIQELNILMDWRGYSQQEREDLYWQLEIIHEEMQ